MKLKILLTATILALLFQSLASAAIYRWVDKNGVVTFRDTPPAEHPEQAQIVSSAQSPAITSSPANPAPAGTKEAAVLKEEVAAPQVELYVTSWCGYCKQAEAFFRSQGIPFTAYDIEQDRSAAERKNQLDSRGGVPFAIINGRKVHGFSVEAYREALGQKP